MQSGEALLVEKLARLGVEDPYGAARSEITEDIPQVAYARLERLVRTNLMDRRGSMDIWHNETARELTRRYGDGRFIYRRRGPDFLDSETGAVVELTTPRQVTRHVNRPGYGSVIDYATYELP